MLFIKYRERYKTAIEKCNNLEEEVEKLKNELKIERESKQLSNQYLESIKQHKVSLLLEIMNFIFKKKLIFLS